MYAPAYTLCPAQGLARQVVTHVRIHSSRVQGIARPKSDMNVYVPASPFILQDLAQVTMFTPQGIDDAPAFNLLD